VTQKQISPSTPTENSRGYTIADASSPWSAHGLFTAPAISEALRDRVILHRIRSGDSAAFQELASKYRSRLYGMAYRFLRNHEDAEEIAQDSLIRALRGLSSFRGESAFSTWLYRIAVNLARNRYWHSWRRKRHATISLDSPVHSERGASWGEMLPNDADSPADAAETQDMQERIDAGMRQLAQHHREILELRNLAHTSYQDIAETLSISIGTVKSRVARARESLRLLTSDKVA
jgi:RNA polymerase sigma-70 factor, ECF subfamily